MTKMHKNHWIYAVSGAIFFLVAGVNAWMILDMGITPFRIVAVVAFVLGAASLLLVYKRASSSGNWLAPILSIWISMSYCVRFWILLTRNQYSSIKDENGTRDYHVFHEKTVFKLSMCFSGQFLFGSGKGGDYPCKLSFCDETGCYPARSWGLGAACLYKDIQISSGPKNQSGNYWPPG